MNKIKEALIEIKEWLINNKAKIIGTKCRYIDEVDTSLNYISEEQFTQIYTKLLDEIDAINIHYRGYLNSEELTFELLSANTTYEKAIVLNTIVPVGDFLQSLNEEVLDEILLSDIIEKRQF